MAVKYCPSCRTTNSVDAMQCIRCGTMLPQIQQSMQYQQPSYQQPQYQVQYPPQQPTSAQGSHNTWVAVVAVVVVIIVILLILVASSGILSSMGGSHATITINATSTHLLFSISYNMYIEGSIVHNGNLNPLQTAVYVHTYYWSSEDPVSITVSATSSGGGFGGQSDSKTITVSNGGAYTANLLI